MKKIVLFAFALSIVLPYFVKGQIVNGVHLADSFIINFTNSSIPNFINDTSTNPLWQIGHSHKSFLGDTVGVTAIMTDTLHPYPINANNWFIIKLPDYPNTVVDFWHKYQTDSTHDGGIVEFSLDSGSTWQNVKGNCNTDSFGVMIGVHTDNFYTFNDTLLTGEPSFSGINNSLQYSRLQFFVGIGGATPCLYFTPFAYLRFRFVSDSIADTLAGWIIDSIKIEHYVFPDLLPSISKQDALKAFPNPSYYGIFTFPEIADEQKWYIEVYNAIGERVLKMPYLHSLDLNAYAKGLYFYKVSDGKEYYSGRLLSE